jgi:hypothetical protein
MVRPAAFTTKTEPQQANYPAKQGQLACKIEPPSANPTPAGPTSFQRHTSWAINWLAIVSITSNRAAAWPVGVDDAPNRCPTSI